MTYEADVSLACVATLALEDCCVGVLPMRSAILSSLASNWPIILHERTIL